MGRPTNEFDFLSENEKVVEHEDAFERHFCTGQEEETNLLLVHLQSSAILSEIPNYLR